MADINDDLRTLLQRQDELIASQAQLQKAILGLLQNKAEGNSSSPDDSTAGNQHLGVDLPSRDRRDSNLSKKPSVFSRRTAQSTLLEGRRNPISVYSSESSDSDEGESYFAEDPLQTEDYDDESLLRHVEGHEWNEECKSMLKPLFRRGNVKSIDDYWEAPRLPEGTYGTQADVYEVGFDGSPLHRTKDRLSDRKAWDILKAVNIDITKRQAVGRITIVREPHAQLSGALHFTMAKHFDMDSIFKLLANDSKTKAYVQGHRHKDERRQRSIVFAFKYHTLVDEKRKPLQWQTHETDTDDRPGHVPISTCASIVGLSLGGAPVNRLKRRQRKLGSEAVSHVYDSFAPWHVLSIQCFPDWHSEEHQHETRHHYVNGPDAFLLTLLQEYKDAAKRFRKMAKRIAELATPPSEVIFNHAMRDEMLFEEGDFIWTRRYFWASQTLGILVDDIEEMIAMYKETFTEQMWSGEHKTLFPGPAETSARYSNWRKKMASHRKHFEVEINHLRDVRTLCLNEQKDVKGLREWLFSGTSVHESREAVNQARVTVQQGVNIKWLTLVTIFFLPLTFVTSVFGMTNMPPNDNFDKFAYVTISLCLPTYVLIAVINWDSVKRSISWVFFPFVWLASKTRHNDLDEKFKIWLRQRPKPQQSLSRTSTVTFGPRMSHELSNPPMGHVNSSRGSATLPGQLPLRAGTVHWDLPRYRPKAQVEGLDPSPNTSVPKLEQMEMSEPAEGGRTERRRPRSFTSPLTMIRSIGQDGAEKARDPV